MLIQIAINMLKWSRDKLTAQKKLPAAIKKELVSKLDDVISFIEAVQVIEDNMASVKCELKAVKEMIVDTAKAAKSIPNTWATIAAMPRASTHCDYHQAQELDEES